MFALFPTNARLRYLPSMNSSIPSDFYCFLTKPGSLIYIVCFITDIIVLLPLFTYILYCGFQKWKQMRSSSSGAAVSHSDSFTYHIVFVELIGLLGCIICCIGIYREDVHVLEVVFYPLTFSWHGQALFHILTCLERYVAVVHPITYRKYRNERGIRMRNITNACVWLGTCVLVVLVMIVKTTVSVDHCMMVLSLSIITYCSLSVLWVLTRPSPGKEGGGREAVDQSKQRAFYTILAILGVLLLRFAWGLVWVLYYLSGDGADCVMATCDTWFYLPSSLVLPLLFLNRAGKLVCCRKNVSK